MSADNVSKDELKRRQMIWLKATVIAFFVPLVLAVLTFFLDFFTDSFELTFIIFGTLIALSMLNLMGSFVLYSVWCSPKRSNSAEDVSLQPLRRTMWRNIILITLSAGTLSAIIFGSLMPFFALPAFVFFAMGSFLVSVFLYDVHLAKKFPQFYHASTTTTVTTDYPVPQFSEITYPEPYYDPAVDPTDTAVSVTNPMSPMYPLNLNRLNDD